MKENLHHFVFLVPFKNVKNYINDCIESILKQEYVHFTIYLLDDCSTDGTLDAIVFQDDRIKMIRNSESMGAVANLYHALKTLNIEEDQVIVWVDGDDCLFGNYTLQILNYYYNEGFLITYGQYIDNFGRTGLCRNYTLDEYEDLRKATWKASHLKTFKKSLFDRFMKYDPNGEFLKDKDGNFFMATGDMAYMLPLLELAGYDKLKFVENVLYFYRISPHNDHSTYEGRIKQLLAEEIIREKSRINVY